MIKPPLCMTVRMAANMSACGCRQVAIAPEMMPVNWQMSLGLLYYCIVARYKFITKDA